MKYFTQSLIILLLASSALLASNNSIGINIGQSHSNYHQSNHTGSINLGNTPDETFNSYELYGTLKQDIFGMKPYLSYTYSSNDDLKHQYILVGLNKYYHYLYGGIVVGTGEMKWRYNPLNSSSDNDYITTSLLGGIQVGIEYKITNSIALNLNTKVLYHNYDTKLNPSTTATAEITHNTTTSFGMGLKYSF